VVTSSMWFPSLICVLGEPFGVLRILASLVVAAGLVFLVLAMRGGA
jgi:hypothetical protein